LILFSFNLNNVLKVQIIAHIYHRLVKALGLNLNKKTMSQFIDILEEKCPKCGHGKVFAKKGNPLLFQMPKMNHNCTECGHKFEREPGYFFGSMYVSYAMTVAEMMVVFAVAHFFVKSYIGMVSLIALFAVLLSTFNFRLSRMVWIYMFDSKEKQV